jgi:uncharacterized protein YigA (DUF484 family)
MGDLPARLNALRERNAELERRREKLRDLCQSLDDTVQKIQLMYESMLVSQESQCVDMVAFDDEIKTVTKELFPPQSRPAQVRPREENAKLLMQEIMALQRLDPAGCEQRLHGLDPLLKQATHESRRMTTFIGKYSAFLSG